MYVITGATGNIGSKIAAALIKRGQPVRLIGRNSDKLQPWVSGTVEAFIGNAEDAGFLKRSFAGATAVFAMIPPNMKAENMRRYQNKMAQSLVTALKGADVKYVVSLSSIGAHLQEGTGAVAGLYDFEQMLNDVSGLNVVHLRAAYFMENLYMAADMIKNMNMIGMPVDPDIEFPMVATGDIASVAADYLLNRNWTGMKVHYILGPRDVTYREITEIIGRRLGRDDLAYSRVPYAQAQDFMVQGGMSESAAESMIELARGLNEGRLLSDVTRTELSDTPTTIESFADSFAEDLKK